MGELAKRFGERVRQIRALRGYTQAELADRAGISEEWVRRIERGAASPSFASIESIGQALDAEVTVPLGVVADAEPAEKLAAAVRQLDDQERLWLLDVVALLKARPTR